MPSFQIPFLQQTVLILCCLPPIFQKCHRSPDFTLAGLLNAKESPVDSEAVQKERSRHTELLSRDPQKPFTEKYCFNWGSQWSKGRLWSEYYSKRFLHSYEAIIAPNHWLKSSLHCQSYILQLSTGTFKRDGDGSSSVFWLPVHRREHRTGCVIEPSLLQPHNRCEM